MDKTLRSWGYLGELMGNLGYDDICINKYYGVCINSSEL